MHLRDLSVFDIRLLLDEERADLLRLLRSLNPDEWAAPTEAGHWRVKDVALHLLDDDLGWLSRGRDGDLSGLLPTDGDYRDFVTSLDAKNQRFVVANAGVSARVLCDLLEWSGNEVTAHYASLDLAHDAGNVIWAAGNDAVPKWFDLCRDFTERWVHQQHIRDAIGRLDNHPRFLLAVLRTFIWAFPFQLDDVGDNGDVVEVSLGLAGTWHLTCDASGWELHEGAADVAPTASLSMCESVAWRQLTGLPVGEGDVVVTGDPELTAALLQVRGIIA